MEIMQYFNITFELTFIKLSMNRYTITLIAFFAFLIFSCKKETITPPIAPTKLTAAIISSSSANLTWTDNSTNESGFKIERKTTNGTYALVGSVGENITTYNDATLTPGTSYIYRIFSYNKGGNSITYSNEATATTYNIPTLSTSPIYSITATTAVSGGKNVNDNGSAITARGICWSIKPSPTINDSTSGISSGTLQNYSSNLRNLIPATKYYVRAFATNSAGTAYGDEVSFTTFSQTAPTSVSTNPISGIYYYSANSGGKIVSDGYANITAKGIVWSTTPNPTIANNKTNDGTGLTSFNSFLGNLIQNTTYYVRAYATNTIGTTYGDERTFTTKPNTTPILASGTITNITSNSALFSDCSVSDDGGLTMIARGSCWSTTPNPTTASNITNDGIALTYYSSQLTNLKSNTTYYARAYATNSMGTSYGIEKTFTTPLALGQNYKGGMIAYILTSTDPGFDPNVQHGIITTSTDQSTNSQWGCDYTTLGIYSTAIGTGNSNTDAIIKGCSTANIAAKICKDFSSGGYSDWFLPSKDELYKLYLNRSIICGFSSNYYWSSTEEGGVSGRRFVSILNFSDGTQTTGTKTNSNSHVRAIRMF
jgi:hypothetical protein